MLIVKLNQRILKVEDIEVEISHEYARWLIRNKDIKVKYDMRGFYE